MRPNLGCMFQPIHWISLRKPYKVTQNPIMLNMAVPSVLTLAEKVASKHPSLFLVQFCILLTLCNLPLAFGRFFLKEKPTYLSIHLSINITNVLMLYIHKDIGI